MLLWLVIAYLAVSVGIGLYAATKVHNAKDYITAGRNLPMALVLAMVFATWFGAETVLGISATFLEEGFRGLISDPLGASICLVVFGLVFARPLYRMNLMTLGDYFRIRYNRQTELLLSICIIVSYLGWVSAQITALGLTFNVLSNDLISTHQGMLIGAGVVLIYTLFGGMWSVALTTFVQMIVIVIGLLLVANNAAEQAGGVASVIAKASAEGKFDFLPTFDPIDMLGWIAALLTMALGSIPQQDVFQRVNASKNETVAVWGTTLGGVAYFFFAAVPLFLAYTANIIDPAMVKKFLADDSQMILPTLILNHMPFVMQVVFFGALISNHEHCLRYLTCAFGDIHRKRIERLCASNDRSSVLMGNPNDGFSVHDCRDLLCHCNRLQYSHHGRERLSHHSCRSLRSARGRVVLEKSQ